MHYRLRYRFENVHDLFMSSDIWTAGMFELIEMFITCRQQQDQIDSCYVKFCETVTTEMGTFLKYSDSSNR